MKLKYVNPTATNAEMEEKERELYAVKHDMVSTQMKLEAALKQQEKLGERMEEWKKKYEELKAETNGRHKA